MSQSDIAPKHFTTLAQITLQPGEKIDYTVGVYETVLPQPYLRLQITPQPAGYVHTSLIRLDGEGDYTLVYHLNNTSKQTCHVIIRSAWPDDN